MSLKALFPQGVFDPTLLGQSHAMLARDDPARLQNPGEENIESAICFLRPILPFVPSWLSADTASCV